MKFEPVTTASLLLCAVHVDWRRVTYVLPPPPPSTYTVRLVPPKRRRKRR